MTTSKFVFLVLGLACTSLAQTARAEPITFQFSGYVSYVDPILAGRFSVGDSMTASYTFESETPCSLGCSGSLIHTYFAALSGGSLHVGSYAASYSDDAVELSAVNNEPVLGAAVRDSYQADIIGLVGPVVGGLAPLAFDVTLVDTSAAVFSGVALPLDLHLASFSTVAPGFAFGRSWILEFGDFTPPSTFILGEVTSLTVVPEPGFATTLVSGIAMLHVLARRRNNSRSGRIRR